MSELMIIKNLIMFELRFNSCTYVNIEFGIIPIDATFILY